MRKSREERDRKLGRRESKKMEARKEKRRWREAWERRTHAGAVKTRV